MLDFGWAELALIMAVAIFIIGPKEIPAIMLGLGRLVRRFQYIRFALTKQFDDFMNEADLRDMQDEARKRHNIDESEFDERKADDLEMMPSAAALEKDEAKS